MRFLTLVFSFFFTILSIAQNIEGKVSNQYGKPLNGVSVYLDGTSIGTSTNEEGYFKITATTKFNTSLIVRFMGYEDVLISNPYQAKFFDITMAVKENEIEAVTIVDDGFSRKSKLEIFRKQFLGTTKAGKQCKILNEDALVLEYDKKQNMFIAKSYEPIQIENAYLGYKIEFDIYDFYIKFGRKSISEHDVVQSMFLGTSKYYDTSTKEIQRKNRNKVYFGSQMHLFKTIITQNWDAKSFVLYQGSFPVIGKDYFEITQENDFYKVKVTGNYMKTNELTTNRFFAAYNLLYNKTNQSKIVFNTDEFFVDTFGNNTHRDQIIFGGDLGTQKIGNMLPLNFEPTDAE
ncbi:carboxypeptidase-like regulatory domain-containing protein [Flavobacterium sp. 20NA77.7]|uniref:Carboxypeptidase-like regulatory domain-containing protein n=1 Tax=Flavobacterium nakdongensis TaxID=3073563 RepID=A0ABY9R7K4_9FLAO|nr:carboxypeptidase-like regulatory domain-containing protein [Flavobacterium sp. 20NA77.7]WMW77129.1 carboxypeptidase-like regulatory domain-containing protein [Flavobacterium sp. 20NA77.7]